MNCCKLHHRHFLSKPLVNIDNVDSWEPRDKKTPSEFVETFPPNFCDHDLSQTVRAASWRRRTSSMLTMLVKRHSEPVPCQHERPAQYTSLSSKSRSRRQPNKPYTYEHTRKHRPKGATRAYTSAASCARARRLRPVPRVSGMGFSRRRRAHLDARLQRSPPGPPTPL